tara:strand:- start:65 stop:238 length:174 start_codon:yes stop_codon:yes gene_type:complete
MTKSIEELEAKLARAGARARARARRTLRVLVEAKYKAWAEVGSLEADIKALKEKDND